MLILTSSEMADFLFCRRGWWLKYYLQFQPKRYSSPLSIGSMVHEWLEAKYRAAITGDDYPTPADLIGGHLERALELHPENEEDAVKDAKLAMIMCDGYPEWLEETGADAGLEIIGSEMKVEAPVGPYMLRGKIDARAIREIDGKLVQLEHKTVGNFTDIPKYAQSAPQFLTYDLLAFLLRPDGTHTDGVLINMIRKVQRTASAKPPFYDRHEVHHSVEELRSHWKHVLGVGNQITEVRAALDAGGDPHVICPPKADREHTWRCDCSSVSTLIDRGEDWFGYLSEHWEQHDPLERYGEEEAA